MNYFAASATAIVLLCGSAAARTPCRVPESFLTSDVVLTRVIKALKEQHRLDISVIGTGSSTLPGADGSNYAYPARLQVALKELLPGNEIKVTAHIQPRQTTAQMLVGLKKALADDKPTLVIWQAGTFDAMSGVEPEEFNTSLVTGVGLIAAAGSDADLLNMQYSPRTELLLNVSAYADVMHWVAQEHGALLFDRLAIMRYWTEEGTFDLYAPTKKYDMARHVHDCIGRALASQIINAAHLTP